MNKRFYLHPDTIQETIVGATHQSDALIDIYRMVFPEWGRIESLDGWPKVNDRTWKRIASWFQRLDQLRHPDVLPGGLWMNRGFSTDESLDDWEVLVDCEVHYKQVE
jgi:hypothetical protein